MKIRARNSIASCLEIAAETLQESSESPRRDAEILLGEVLECDRTYLFAYSDHLIDEVAHDLFWHYIERRKAGEPVAYILGKREFWSLLLTVNESTLIPRPDTEVLVESALLHCTRENACVLDLGTGTGAVALALASEKSGWHIDAVDAHENAVALAKLNAENLALANVHVYRSNWFEDVSTNTDIPDAQFDLIVSNPPYIAAADPHLLSGDVRFEPHTALVAEDSGYADLFLIAQEARHYLKVNGLLLLEHGFDQGKRMREYLQRLAYVDVKTAKDYGENERVVIARWPGHP